MCLLSSFLTYTINNKITRKEVRIMKYNLLVFLFGNLSVMIGGALKVI